MKVDAARSSFYCPLRCHWFFIFSIFVLLTQPAVAQQTTSSILDGPFTVPRVDQPIHIDGHVDEAVWNTIPMLPLVTHLPNFGQPPSERTEIRIAYDDTYLYVSGRCFDDPSLVQGPTFKRDQLGWIIDQVMIGLDTFNDNENLLAFITTPTGSRVDAHISNDAQGFNRSWDTFWDAASARQEWGWSTEMRIPFSSLRFEEKDGQIEMGLIAFRLISHKFELSVFPSIRPDWGLLSFYKPSQSHPIIFSDLPSVRPVYITPYVLGGLGQDFNLNDASTAYARKDDPTGDVGLDIKYGLTKNLTLDLTINTDFAQVEADNQQVNLTRFSLFFPEQRRFFQERSSNFDFDFGASNRLFYSRRIGLRDGQQVRLLGGARLVGRAGGWDIGLLDVQTARERGFSAENFSVLRLRRQVFNPYSYVGGITTTRLAEDGTYNVTYGLDGIFRLFSDDYLSLNWAQTFDSGFETPLASLDPTRIRLHWEHRAYAGFGYELSYSRAGRTYVPGMGFEFRDDFTSFGDQLVYGWIPDKSSKFQSYRLVMIGNAFLRNSDGSLETLTTGPGVELTWKRGDFLSVSLLRTFEDLDTPFVFSDDADVPEGRYDSYHLEAEHQTPRGNLLRTMSTLYAGTFFDGRRISIGTNPFWGMSRYLNFDVFYQFNHISFPDRNQRFTAHIVRLRFETAINTRFTASTFVQYNSTTDGVVANFRFRANFRDGNDFYLVYNEGINTNRFRIDPRLPFTSTRTLLAKYTHTFLF